MSVTTPTKPSTMTLKGVMIGTVIFLASAFLLGWIFSLFFNARDEAAQEGVITEQITAVSAEIREVTQNNNLPGDSQIAGTAQEAPVEGQIINSETNKTFLFSLPALGRSGLLYDQSYIAVTGTVDDYTITYSSDAYSTVAVYKSDTDKITFSDYKG